MRIEAGGGVCGVSAVPWGVSAVAVPCGVNCGVSAVPCGVGSGVGAVPCGVSAVPVCSTSGPQ